MLLANDTGCIGRPGQTTTPVQIGGADLYGAFDFLLCGNFFNGAIDDVGLFDVALSSTDIQSIMNGGLLEVVGTTAVSPIASSATTWANIKIRY